ncbi:MAG: branched-chain amino acid ABC transporter permease [Desulfurococcaceae archaeon]
MIDVVVVMRSIVYSVVIAIGAIAITAIYGATKTFNFAHASMVSWGSYIVFTMVCFYGGIPYLYFPLAFLFVALLGLIAYLTVNRWLLRAKADDISLMMTTLGVDLIYYAFLNHYADYLLYTHKISVARNFVLEIVDPVLSLNGVTVRMSWVVAPILLAIVLVAVYVIYTKTRIGVAMRATIENPDLAQLQGVNPEVVYTISWILGGGLAGLSGALLVMIFTGRPSIGLEAIVTFFAGAIVGGGAVNLFGAALGGFLVGLSELMIPYALAPAVGGWIYAYRAAVPLAIMAAMLLIEPGGLIVLVKKIKVKR